MDAKDNTVELILEPTGVNTTIEWVVKSLDPGSNYDDVASGSFSPNQTTSSTTWQGDFGCGFLDEFRIQSDGTYPRRLRVIYNGVVRTEVYGDITQQYANQPIAYFGDTCYRNKYELCRMASDDLHFVDVRFTVTRNISDIYWRVYAGPYFGNILMSHNLFSFYQENTTYHSMHCIHDPKDECTVFGLHDGSNASLSDLTLRVDGKEKNKPWTCVHFTCETDITTELMGCSNTTFSTGELVMIGIASFVGGMILMGAVILLGRYYRRENCSSKENNGISAERVDNGENA